MCRQHREPAVPEGRGHRGAVLQRDLVPITLHTRVGARTVANCCRSSSGSESIIAIVLANTTGKWSGPSGDTGSYACRRKPIASSLRSSRSRSLFETRPEELQYCPISTMRSTSSGRRSATSSAFRSPLLSRTSQLAASAR